MVSEPTPAPLARDRDAQLQWVLCLAAAHQVAQAQQGKFADKDRRHFQSELLRGVQGLLKSLRWTERKRAA
jgi:hypothetical protein